MKWRRKRRGYSANSKLTSPENKYALNVINKSESCFVHVRNYARDWRSERTYDSHDMTYSDDRNFCTCANLIKESNTILYGIL